MTDPRRRKVVHPLLTLLTIAVCAVNCGADDFVAIAAWARQKRDWLATILDLSHGAPSHDRFNAVLGARKPAEFETCLPSWITTLHEVTAGQVVAIDGKTLRRRFDTASSQSAIPMVSDWATAHHLTLGQEVVDAKSNAIPKLREVLAISGGLVTIDAMGCQTAIAKAIVAGGADYVRAVKENPPTLHAGTMAHFLDNMEDDLTRVKVGRHETKERGHGRDEHRTSYGCDVPADLPDRARWKDLKRMGMAINATVRNDQTTDAVCLEILSKRLSAALGRSKTAVIGVWT